RRLRLRRHRRLDLVRLDPTIDIARHDSEPRAELRCSELAAFDRAVDGLAAETAHRRDLVGCDKPTVRSVPHPIPRLLAAAIVLLVRPTGTRLRATRLRD